MGIFNFKKREDVKELGESLERENKNKLFAWDIVKINKYIVDEQIAWYSSDSNIILDFYSAANLKRYPQQFMFYRNCENYFWSKSAKESKIKRTTAGVMYSIIKIIVDIVGIPKISIIDKKINDRMKEIEKSSDFLMNLYYGKQMHSTAVIGWGAYRIDINTNKYEFPKIRYYDGRNCSFEEDIDGIKKIKFLDYFLYNNKEYVLVDERFMLDKDTSCIETHIYEILENQEWVEQNLKDFPNVQVSDSHIEVKAPFILAEPCRWYENLNNGFNEGLYGRGLFYGKVDSLDDYDQAVSIASTTIRRATPKVSYPVDSLETDRNGNSKIPDRFDLEFIQVPTHITGDGKTIEKQGPTVVQPNVVIDIFTKEQDQILDHICAGLISVGDVGMNKNAYLYRDSGTALRERSKQTLFTRELICNKEQKMLKSLWNKVLYLDSLFYKQIPLKLDYDIEILYDKFSIPSKEERVKVYLPMFQSGAISDEMFVSAVYDDDLSEEDKVKEMELIKKLREEKNNPQLNQKVPEVPRSTSPYEASDRLDNQSGMNNYNRGVKAVKDI